MPSGNPNVSQMEKRGVEMELLAVNHLKEQGYEIIHSGAVSTMERREERKKGKIKLGGTWMKESHKRFEPVLALKKKLGLDLLSDMLCKKDNQYYLFEIKSKIWKEGRPHFNSSELQISDYNRVHNAGKVKIKVLTIIEKGQKLSYNIYDWDDFEKTKSTIKLKNRSPIKIKNKNQVKLKSKSRTKDSPSLAKLLKSMMINRRTYVYKMSTMIE